MRIANVGRWVNRNLPIYSEMYRADRRYEVVVFVKAMDENARRERERVQARGAKAVFDANVNYYEIWGDYELPNTQPTEEQRATVEGEFDGGGGHWTRHHLSRGNKDGVPAGGCG